MRLLPVLIVPLLATAALAQPPPWRGTCAAVADAVARDNAREAAAFEASLGTIPQAVLAERGGPPGAVDRDQALAIGRALWAAWGWRARGAHVAVASESADHWLLQPMAGSAPLGTPMRVDRRSGRAAWRLPHPSAKEAWLAAQCAPAR